MSEKKILFPFKLFFKHSFTGFLQIVFAQVSKTQFFKSKNSA